MKKLISLSLIILLLNSCKKDGFEMKNVEVKVVHHTCVQTIVSITKGKTIIGEAWTDADNTIYRNCFNLGANSSIQIDRENQVFIVDIKPAPTKFISGCFLNDIKGTSMVFDVVEK